MADTKILDVTKDVKWIGALDPDIFTFDIVMETKFGTTYNAYFINAEKKTIVETVKKKYKEEFVNKIATLTNPESIEYIICDHTEPDHSGSLKYLLKAAPGATVVGSGQALNYLKEMIGVPFKSLQVKDGDVLDLGNKKIRFIGAPNLHWPDSIYSYLEEDKILFTCDSFGAHYCKNEMYDDQVGDYTDAFNYYFDVILKPYSRFMLKAIEKIEPLDIAVIAPGHGPILRSTVKEVIQKSKIRAQQYLSQTDTPNRKVLITYVSAYGYTKEMAGFVAEGIRSKANAEIDVVNIENILLGDLEEKIVNCSAVLIGSPTINQNTLLPIYKMFALINPIRDRGKLAAAFGSYGWSGEAVGIIEGTLKNLKLKVIEGVNAKFHPNGDKASVFIEFGKKFAEELDKCQ